jgi:hypothetical protein
MHRQAVLVPLLSWALTCGFGWLWWRYFKSGVVYRPGGRFTRAQNPFNYWLAMAMLATAVGVFAVCSVWVTLLALGTA